MTCTHLILAVLCLEEVFSHVHWQDVRQQLEVVRTQTLHVLLLLVRLQVKGQVRSDYYDEITSVSNKYWVYVIS